MLAAVLVEDSKVNLVLGGAALLGRVLQGQQLLVDVPKVELLSLRVVYLGVFQLRRQVE